MKPLDSWRPKSRPRTGSHSSVAAERAPGRNAFRPNRDGLEQVGPAALPSLISNLDDGSEAVRVVATRTIGSLGIASQAEAKVIVEAFIKQLRDESDEVRYAAIIGLIRLAADWDVEAIPGLVTALQDKASLSKVDRSCLEQGAAHVFGKSGAPRGDRRA